MKLLKRILFLFPTALPRTNEDFDEFAKSIFETYDLPDMPGYRQAVASQVMHLHPLCTHKSKRFFARSIRKAQCNEAAYMAIEAVRKAAKENEKKVVQSPSA